jgi:hypothetical protein
MGIAFGATVTDRRCGFDDRPSLVLSPAEPWHCLGACRAGARRSTVMKAEGVSFGHDPEADFFPTSPSLDGPRSTPASRGSPARRLDADDHDCSGRSAATDREESRPSAVSRSGPSTPSSSTACRRESHRGYRLPRHEQERRARRSNAPPEAGVLRDSSHEHLNGSLVIGIFGEGGEVLSAFPAEAPPTCAPAPGTSLLLALTARLNISPRPRRKSSCESLIDALTFGAGFLQRDASTT